MRQATDQMGKEGEYGANVLIRGHKCYRCGHEWRPYELSEVPRVCPKCKNPYWDRPKQNKKVAKK